LNLEDLIMKNDLWVILALFLLAVFCCVSCVSKPSPAKYNVGDQVCFVLKPSVHGIVTEVDSIGGPENTNSYRVQYVESGYPGMTKFASNWFKSGELMPITLAPESAPGN
jgi:hypothetical protein